MSQVTCRDYMKKGTKNMERKWVFSLVITSLVCVFIFVSIFNMGLVSSMRKFNSLISIFPSHRQHIPLAEAKAIEAAVPPPPPPPPPPPIPIPRFAYLISGSKGDLDKLWRTLRALYHPLNEYVVHLDLESPVEERLELTNRVDRDPIFAQVGNVHMITKANMITYRGPTMIANTLHACAILLKRRKDWDWFINLSASDYPLVTQDDLLYTFSRLDRKLNFIEHTSNLSWKAEYRAMPLMVDPGLYHNTKQELFWVTPSRDMPTAFNLFTGSAWTVLSRSFVEYVIWGWDNLPRVLLMYYANFVSSPEFYFQTVVCNAPQFVSTVVNHDMHFIAWDDPPQQHPMTLNMNHSSDMFSSGAPFARKFIEDSDVLDKIDEDILGRVNGSFTPGGWCAGIPLCSEVGNPKKLKPGRASKRLKRLIRKLTSPSKLRKNQCRLQDSL